jgi:lysophospholipase L1-like esterase
MPTVFLAGDSTMADKPLIGNPERGWGQLLPAFFAEGVRVENHAKNGRSTKSFVREGRWAALLERVRPGDYVLIQFGHNDQKISDSTRYADPQAAYRNALTAFAADVRSRGGTPVLLTPVARRRFADDGSVADTHGEYARVVLEVGSRAGCPVIDLNGKSRDLFQRLGPEETKRLFLWVKPGRYSALHAGREDNTHFTPAGAAAIARLVADGIRELKLPLASSLKAPERVRLEGIGRTVLLDNYYNDESRADSSGLRRSFHYLWHDSTNSGFSLLAELIARTGACLDTLRRPPEREALSRASLYLIVDPDTPAETSDPKPFAPGEVDAIVEWVAEGGTLVLLANDAGNCNLEGLNLLAGRFGVRFNEDGRNRVKGTDYAVGTLDRLPDHPIFRDVRRIYIKELSTLTLRPPAQAILTEGGDLIMAGSEHGRGFVFALGDPWLYDEYLDARKLGPGYGNAAAGENLFRWLLSRSMSVE